MNSSFDLVLEKIKNKDPKKADDMKDFLIFWRTKSPWGIRIVDNLMIDSKIPVDSLESILETVYFHKALPLERLEYDVYRTQCYSYSLKGPEIDKSKISDVVGGTKPTEEFIGALKLSVRTIKKKRANKIVEKLVNNKRLSDGEKQIQLAPFSCWCTWSESNPNLPFDFATDPYKLTKITANLGLSHRQSTLEHLIFTYFKSNVTEIRYPTIADAVLYSYFKCTIDSDYCGRTQPWNPEDCEQRGLSDNDVKPRPEGIHKSIKLEDLILPVQTVQYDNSI